MKVAYKNSVIAEGETVILRFGHDDLVPVTLRGGGVTQTKFGAVRHDSVIGGCHGDKVEASRGFVAVLGLTPELWSAALPHRTQIIYPHDAALIVAQLELRPGSVVAEAGTGSGALTHSLVRAVAPHGHVHTFEFHEQRAQIAAQEFIDHKMTDYVTGSHRDVLGQGFPEGLQVDAVMLDLPQPWSMVEHVCKTLRIGGRVCFFSPCIEQVQRTCENLRSAGFTEILPQECIQRSYSIVKANTDILNLGQDFVDDRSECGAVDYDSCHRLHKTCFVYPQNEERWEAVPQNSAAGHTGYLTFATRGC